MRGYSYKRDDGELVCCDSCQAVAPVSTFERHAFERGPLATEKWELCEPCAGSFIANAVEYPRQYENVALYQALGHCTNLILDAITKRRPK